MKTLHYDGAEETYGFILDGKTYTFTHEEYVNTVQSEAIALLEGLKEAKKQKIKNLEIIGDSKNLTQMVLGVSKPNKKIQPTIKQIHKKLLYFDDFIINWVPRHLNPADEISRKTPG